MPLLFAVVALGVLLIASVSELHPLSVGLAAATLVAVMGRLILMFRENTRMLQTSRDEALTDPLTGLANRRALTRRLECDLPDASDERPLVLALFDLDGFELSSHVDGVAELAEAIARRLALDEEQVEHIRHAAELHDVGKMAKYPDRLAGRAIPLGSRVVAVADAFDAMTADRSYSRPRTPGAALAELRRCAGGQFDLEVVEAFGAVWAERETRVAS